LPVYQALKHPDKLFLPVKGAITKEPIGFAVRKGDFDTLNFLDNWIRVVEAEGWLAERKAYWFETQEWESLLK
jgi:polar amino acid transport system substrate-binding protein